jgi:ribonuclease P protein component
VLTRVIRLTSGAAFARAIRHGRRAGSRTLVLHLTVPPPDAGEPDAAQVGFVVSKAVGSAVTRNLVKRRLRHLARERLATLPGRAVPVERALPTAAEASYADLAADFDSGLRRVVAGRRDAKAAR